MECCDTRACTGLKTSVDLEMVEVEDSIGDGEVGFGIVESISSR